MKSKTVLLVMLGTIAWGAAPRQAHAEQYLGEIRWVAFNFAPVGWAQCNGQIMSISQNTALFALLGTTYGGDGKTTFALPDMRGRTAVHENGVVTLGQAGGQEAITLTPAQLPAHNHLIPALSVTLSASSAEGTTATPAGNVLAVNHKQHSYHPGPADVTMAAGSAATSPGSTDSAGGGQPVPTMSPYLGLNCIIALQGIFPSQN
jgi:microcystin-dependent protein